MFIRFMNALYLSLESNMSSSKNATDSTLAVLLKEFKKLLLLWADHPVQCDRKRLIRLNVSTSCVGSLLPVGTA
jgi:hypothetical protein